MNAALVTLLSLGVSQTSEDPSRLRVVPSDQPIEIGVGETVMVQHTVRVRRPKVVATPPAWAVRASIRRVDVRNVDIPRWAEVRDVRSKRTRVWIPLTGTGVSEQTLSIGVELLERGAGDPVALARVSMKVQVVAKRRTERDVDAAMAAYEREQRVAEAAYKALPKLHDWIRLDRFKRPPPGERVDDRDVRNLRKFTSARFRAHAARRFLRFAADDPDPEIAFAATRGIGKLTTGPTGALASASAIDGVSNAKAIQLISRAIDDLRVDEAEGYTIKLHESGRLDTTELAEVLVLRGFAEIVRSAPKAAAKSFGQALCIDREVDTAVKRKTFLEALAKARDDNQCDRPIAVDQITAERIGNEDGKVIRIIASFGPDPHRLVEKANVQLWGYGGAVETAVTVAALHAGGHRIEANLADAAVEADGRVLLKVFLLDRHGIEIAAQGDPDPVSVPLVIGSGGGAGVPWWVWAAIGGVVVAGAATAGVVALANQGEVQRVIGPVEVRF